MQRMKEWGAKILCKLSPHTCWEGWEYNGIHPKIQSVTQPMQPMTSHGYLSQSRLGPTRYSRYSTVHCTSTSSKPRDLLTNNNHMYVGSTNKTPASTKVTSVTGYLWMDLTLYHKQELSAVQQIDLTGAGDPTEPTAPCSK